MRGVPRRSALGLGFAVALMPVLARAQDGDVREPIVALYRALEDVMRAGKAVPFRQRFDTLAPVIDRVFDLETILQVSVGLRWNSIDAAAKATLLDAFRRFTIATYVANFNSFDGERFEVLPELRSIGADRVVQTRIAPARGDTVRMDYVMRSAPRGWRVVDVLLDGTISRVAVQRSDFRSLLARGDTTALLDSLRRKTADLSGGALAS
ncbi:MAG: ABC transporter substrate-binding protein [Acetobacteraceae bacterium]